MGAIIPLTANGTSTFFNSSATADDRRACLAVLKTGLVLLLVVGIGLLGILGVFWHRWVSHEARNREGRMIALVLIVIGILVFARNIFCMVQIFSPSGDQVWRVEAFFWIFDASPLLIGMLLLNALHPGRLVPVRVGRESYECH